MKMSVIFGAYHRMAKKKEIESKLKKKAQQQKGLLYLIVPKYIFKMSVILTACRHSKQKAVEKALKKRAEKQKEKRQKAMDAVHEQIGPLPTESPSTRIWTFLLDGNPYNKDTLDVYCNGNEVESRIDFEDDGNGNRIDFEVGPHKARITSEVNQCSKEGIVHTLTIDGSAVPE
ncbi:hypothetical protein KUTeg_012535 [Tegillarca granosa]|uniref:Uncharacterized protein n=1 Tax=Tegillarca granosa TaxID=220873 RepID=A0ABQ9EZS5_TEGGR|nr:hypothetical protein KUTeg_012535 [Tegillarca granosa]